MNALLQQVMGSIDSSLVNELAGRMGVPPAQAQDAISHAMPALLGAIGQHASSSAGADAIHAVAQQMLGTNGNSANVQGLLAHVFAGTQGVSAAGLASTTELQQIHAQHLLTVLGPVILAAIGQHAAPNSTGVPGLSQLIGAAAQHAQTPGGGVLGGLLGSLFQRF